MSSHRIKLVLSFIWVLEIQKSELYRGSKIQIFSGAYSASRFPSCWTQPRIGSKFLRGFFKAMETCLSVCCTCWDWKGGFLAACILLPERPFSSKSYHNGALVLQHFVIIIMDWFSEENEITITYKKNHRLKTLIFCGI